MSEVKRFKPVINSTPYKPYAYCEENEEGIYVRIHDYAELKAQRDALAAENAALKFVQKGLVKLVSEHLEDASLAGAEMKTPATDACLNSVRAEGVEMCAEVVLCYAFPTMRTAYHNAVTGILAKLRAGKDGE